MVTLINVWLSACEFVCLCGCAAPHLKGAEFVTEYMRGEEGEENSSREKPKAV